MHRLFQHRFKNWSKIARRGINDAQDLGGRGLLIQCLAGLGDQPCVLNRDYRLCREILQQRDLFVRERAYFLAIDCDDAQNDVVLAQPDAQ